jgi:16S rRNA (cytosine967-C5)-methyltransferase
VRGENPREIAAEILYARHRGVFVDTLLDEALRAKKLSPEDRRFLQELVYGVVRWQLTLDWLIDQKTGAKPQKPIVQNLLRLALYQMFWLERVPFFAAINESVEICKRRGLAPQAKFMNAVLRGYGREAEATQARLDELRRSNPSVGYSHPDWLCSRWRERFGPADTARLLEWNNTPAQTFARLNTLKATEQTLRKAWESEGVRFEPVQLAWVPENTVFRLTEHPPIASLPSFSQGFFYIQDPSTLLSVHLLAPERGEAILDLCAAPGGKTTYLAQRLENTGRVVAQDLDPARLKMVTENAQRLGASCVTTQMAADSIFDRILIDAPCSNTGVMRRRVELRWRIQPEEIARLARTQVQLLHSAAKRLRLGGAIVYSTCSLEREENEAVVREFLAANNRFQMKAERTLTPFREGVDGAYAALLTSSAS